MNVKQTVLRLQLIQEKEQSRLHFDAHPFKRHVFLVIVDAYGKWMYVYITHSVSAIPTVEACKDVLQHTGF